MQCLEVVLHLRHWPKSSSSRRFGRFAFIYQEEENISKAKGAKRESERGRRIGGNGDTSNAAYPMKSVPQVTSRACLAVRYELEMGLRAVYKLPKLPVTTLFFWKKLWYISSHYWWSDTKEAANNALSFYGSQSHCLEVCCIWHGRARACVMEEGIATMTDGGERIPGCFDVSRLINTFQFVCSFI